MKWFIGIILVTVVATVLGILVVNDPGYVLLAYHQWTMEMPLWLAIILLLLTLLLLRWLGHLLSYVFHFKQRATVWYQHRRQQRAQTDTDQGLLAYAIGDWPRAKKHLSKAAANTQASLAHYLLCAQAAQHQHNDEQRDHYLAKAQRKHPHAHLTIQLTKAQFQIDDQQYLAALSLLNELPSQHAQHPRELALRLQIYRAQGDWSQCAELLPSLKAKSALNRATLQREELIIKQHLLQQARTAEDQGAKLHRVWQSLSHTLQQEPLLITEHVRGLLHYQQTDQAERGLRTALKLHPANAVLIELYGHTHSRFLDKQLTIAKSWLKTTPHRATLLLTLARLAIANELWGQAREYLIESLQLQPRPHTYLTLAQLLDHLGETT
ncbi:MAG: hypothetical protein GKR77_00005, partial [Legionellales bacterium]|nr:hypothetical protein [Legionellales bacterium]